MSSSSRRRVALALLATALLVGEGQAASTSPSVKVGGMCDRTGSTRVIGSELCPGVADYIALVNRKGGVLGHRIEYQEIEHAYLVPRAVDAYERLKQDGAVTFFNYGVPTLIGLAPRFMADRLPGMNSGTGRSDMIDGAAWPYVFPGTASYWSQAAVAFRYIKDNGARKGARIAFLYYDNPAGRDGIAMVETIAAKEGFVLRKYAVQPPGLGMQSQVTDIAREFKADWVIGSLFGEPAAVSIREFRSVGFPLNRVISFVYGAGEPDVAGAGWDMAQGYLGLQYASPGRDFPLIQEIIAMLREEGKEVPKYVGGAYYNRGVLTGAIMVEAIRVAIEKHGVPVTGEQVRRGYESIRKLDLGGLGPPLSITPEDHEGGGYLRVYQVKGERWVPATDWIRAYREDVMSLARKANGR